MKYDTKITLIALVMIMSAGAKSVAEESNIEKAETVKNKVFDGTKRAYRKMDDKICETINGKVECVSKSMMNKIKNTSDKIKTDSKETINKVD